MLHNKIYKLFKEKYEDLFNYQKQTIDKIKKGRNLLIIAPTGFGKTLAAMLPVFDCLLSLKGGEGIKALYITPLRALNRDICERLVWWGSKLDLDVQIRHGDTSQKQRTQQSKNPPDILITTPEMLQAIITGKNLRKALCGLKFVVIDEIHELAEDKRGVQLSICLERLGKLSKFQRIGLSATIGNPEEVLKFLVGAGKGEIIKIGEKKEYEIKLLTPSGQEKSLSSKLFVSNDVASCIKRIQKAVEKANSTLLFVNTREAAEFLGSRFKMLKMPVGIHHSSLSRKTRMDAEKGLKSKEIKSLICTSSMELGIDIGSIDFVVQWSSPRQVTRLVQRIGRSGHARKRVSKGILFALNLNDWLESKAIISRFYKNWIEPINVIKNSLDVLCHQVIGICMDFGEVSEEFIFNIVKNSYSYQNLGIQELEELLGFMEQINLIRKTGKTIRKTRRGLLYYFENLSTIPDERSFLIIDSQNNEKIGILHEGFVIENDPGTVFICRGEPWRITEVKENKVFVVRDEFYGAIPSWRGELIPVPFEIAQEVGKLRKIIENPVLLEQKNHKIPDEKTIFIEKLKEEVIIHACFGTKVNNTLGKLLGALISQKIGASVGIRTNAYSIILKISHLIDLNYIKNLIEETNIDWVDDIIKKILINSSEFSWHFSQIAKKMGIIKKNSEIKKYKIKKLIKIYENSPVVKETINKFLNKKLDIKKLKEILLKIKKNKIKISITKKINVSPLGKISLENLSGGYLKSKKPIKEIINLVINRLNNKKYGFICLNCGKNLGIFTVKFIKKDFKCPSCRAKFIGFVPERRISELNLIKKAKNPENLSEEEKNIINKIIQTGNLFLACGNLAPFVMAGKGIGPTVGFRILSKIYATEEDLIKEIIKEERKFLRTHMFWFKKPKSFKK